MQFFEKINKLVKYLVKLTKKMRKWTQITNIRNKRVEITTDVMYIQRIIKEYYKQSMATNLEI